MLQFQGRGAIHPDKQRPPIPLAARKGKFFGQAQPRQLIAGNIAPAGQDFRGREAALAELGVTGFNSGMPAFGDTLTEEEIWNILAFIRSTWPERIQQSQASRNRPHN